MSAPRRRHSFTCTFVLTALATLSAAAGAAASDATRLDVEIDGIEGNLLENVRLLLGIVELTEREDDEAGAAPAEIRRRHRAAPEQIRQALMPFGYYRPSIDAELTHRGDGDFTARYRIEPGEPARLQNIDVRAVGEGAGFPAIDEALRDVDLESGQRLSHADYENAKQNLFNVAYDSGFLDASWRASAIRVAPDRLHADIDLVLDTGPRFYFGEITIEQDVLNQSFVAGFVDIDPGDAYNVGRLLELQRTLNEAGYFSRVEVQAPREAADARQRVPVTVRTEPAKPQRYSVGLGYGTDTGPRATLGVLLRRINARGHRLRADLQLSTIEQAIGARYDIPIRNYATDTLSFSVTASQEEIGDAETEQIVLGVSQTVSWLGFRRRLYLEAEREAFEFDAEPRVTSYLVYPGMTLTRERADDLQYPRRGYLVRADLRSGLEALLSDVSFSRLEILGRWTRAIASQTRVLLRAEAGVLWTDEFAALPPSQRFFAGGDRSIRGYGYRQVGPENSEGDVIGGERMVSGSIELDHLFYGNYGGAVFVDVGDAFDGSPDLQVGAGVGFRWRSPIGMLRLDVAHPFDDPDDDYRIHLTIGADL